jgi:hypothetical protein
MTLFCRRTYASPPILRAGPNEYPPVDLVVVRAEEGFVGRLVLCHVEGVRAGPVTGYHVALLVCGHPPEPGERLAEEPERSAIIISCDTELTHARGDATTMPIVMAACGTHKFRTRHTHD